MKESNDVPNSRPYDVIILGASGFTGRWAVRHILNTYTRSKDDKTFQNLSDGTLKIALAGRNVEKIENVRTEAFQSVNMETDQADTLLPILTADVQETESLRTICAKTRVLVNYVGPYLKFGEKVVEACVLEKTDYCDLTGEDYFVKQMQIKYSATAMENDVKIVHFCGFDCVPSDLGVLMMQQYSIDTFGKPCEQARLYVHDMQGGFSEGTLNSMMGILELDEDNDWSNENYLCLNQVTSPHDPVPIKTEKVSGTVYDEKYGYVVPFVMSAINEKVVRWSSHLANYPYGREFAYSECLVSYSGWLKAACKSAMTQAFFFMIKRAIFRKLISAASHYSQGKGPTDEALKKGYFVANTRGICTDSDGNKRVIVVKIGMEYGDPGYIQAAKMCLESGLTLALQRDECPKRAGVLSPSIAIGMPLVKRLQNTGITWKVETEALEPKEPAETKS